MLMTTINRKATLALIAFSLLNLAGQSFATDLPTVEEVLIETPFKDKHIKQVLKGEIATTRVVPVSKTELAQGVACLIPNGRLKDFDTLENIT
jgi:hypothetical protein